MIGNELNTLMTLINSATRNDGRSSGSVIDRYVRQGDAPSTRAASYSSAGIVCRPVSSAYVENGSDTKTATTIIQTNAESGRPSQSAWLLPKCLTTPMSCRKTLTTPYCGSSAQRKMNDVISTEAAHGAISAQRAARRPGKRWLNNWARPSDSVIVTATTTTTQTAVRIRMLLRSGSSNRSLKFRQPAAPRLNPPDVKRWND